MNCVRKLLKRCGWAWDRVGVNHFAACVTPGEECQHQLDPVTITVRLEAGTRAGGWWVETTDTTWGIHQDSLLEAMLIAEDIRRDREALMERSEAGYFQGLQTAYINAKTDYLRDDSGADAILKDNVARLARELPEDLLLVAEKLVERALFKIGVTSSGAPIVMAS
jgi:hypothetical protein